MRIVFYKYYNWGNVSAVAALHWSGHPAKIKNMCDDEWGEKQLNRLRQKVSLWDNVLWTDKSWGFLEKNNAQNLYLERKKAL